MITTKLRYLRISPRKVRLVTDLIRGLSVIEAATQLKFLTKRAARPILKLLNSAIANAQHNANLTKENLYLDKVIVDKGPVLKRWRARAMGRATPILKRTSHITLVLAEKEPGLAQKDKKVKPTKEEKSLTEKEERKGPEKLDEIQKIEEEKGPVAKPKAVPPPRPYPTTPQAKKRFFSRQTFGNIKKYFRRKSF